MPRKVTILAVTIVGLHIVAATFLGSPRAGLCSETCCKLLRVLWPRTHVLKRRGDRRGLGRRLDSGGSGNQCWGLANIGWTYYEVRCEDEPPELSFVRFMFDMQEAFFAMAILLDRDDRPST
jgi:hypothetical protein